MLANLLLLGIGIVVLPVGLVGVLALFLTLFLLFDYFLLARRFFLFRWLLLLFVFLRFGNWPNLGDCARRFFPVIRCPLQNLFVNRVFAGMHQSEPIVRQFLFDAVRIKPHAGAVLRGSQSLESVWREHCLLIFLLHFPSCSLPMVHRHLNDVEAVFNKRILHLSIYIRIRIETRRVVHLDHPGLQLLVQHNVEA